MEDISFAKITQAIFRKKWVVVLSVICCFAIANVYIYFKKPLYESVLIVVPSQATAQTNSLIATLGSLSGATTVNKDPNVLINVLLGSVKFKEKLRDELKRKKILPEDSVDLFIQTARSNITSKVDKNGYLNLVYKDVDTIRLSKILNLVPDLISALQSDVNSVELKTRREIAERQLADAKNKLSEAEVSLKSLQEKTGLLMADEQIKNSISQDDEIRNDLATKEAELAVLKSYLSASNPEVQKKNAEITALKNKKQSLNVDEYGVVSNKKAPKVSLEYVRRSRDVKYYEAIFDVIARQYEAAKMEESKQSNQLNILDYSTSGSCYKIKPKERNIRLLSIVLGLVLGVVIALGADLIITKRRLL